MRTKFVWIFLFLLLLFLGIWAVFVMPIPGTDDAASASTSAPELAQAVASGNLSKIALTYFTYSITSQAPRNLRLPPGSTAHDAAFFLAQKTGLNDASVYFVRPDPLHPGPVPPVVIAGDIPSATAPAPDFANSTLAVVLLGNIPSDSPPATTPFAWTRGLQPTGAWSADSPWNGTSGGIAFLDGHVEWFSKLDATDPKSSLLKYGTGTPTANISEALPPGAVVLSAEPRPAAH